MMNKNPTPSSSIQISITEEDKFSRCRVVRIKQVYHMFAS